MAANLTFGATEDLRDSGSGRKKSRLPFTGEFNGATPVVATVSVPHGFSKGSILVQCPALANTLTMNARFRRAGMNDAVTSGDIASFTSPAAGASNGAALVCSAMEEIAAPGNANFAGGPGSYVLSLVLSGAGSPVFTGELWLEE